MSSTRVLNGNFPNGAADANADTGRRPVIFDILGPDLETSILPEGYKLVLHINPTTLSLKYKRKVERIQTKGGFVEQHWGDDLSGLDLEMNTGAFMRLYTGVTAVTSPVVAGGSRRETLAYDSFLDMLALFHHNGSIFDTNGQVVLQGIIKVTFDGGVYLGHFSAFSVNQNADQPYQFTMSASMDITHEIQVWRTAISYSSTTTVVSNG